MTGHVRRSRRRPAGLFQQAFLNAYPNFHVRFVKGERVEGSANFEKQVNLALTCDRDVRYVEGSRPELASQRAFHATLAERGMRRFEAMGCWIAHIH